MLSSIYENRKEYDKAIEALERGQKADGKNVELIFRMGVVLDKKGDKEKGIGQMQRILEIQRSTPMP